VPADLVAVAMHDLRSPLSAVTMTATKHARPSPRAASVVRSDAELILRAARRMERIIADVVELAHLESGTLLLEMRPTTATALVAPAVEAAGEPTNGRHVVLRVHPDARGAVLTCDRERVCRILARLIASALESAPMGGTVVVGLARGEREVIFSVANDVADATTADGRHAFDLRTDGDDAAVGLNVGLVVAKRLVEEHGGRFRAPSQEARERRVSFTLPISATSRPERGDEDMEA
jgi:signal transduction histidine kinase